MGYDILSEMGVENEPPDDPFMFEAREHADAETGWMEEEVNLGNIPRADYERLYAAAVEHHYQRLLAEAKADLEARRCECGGYFEYIGQWICDKCGKTQGEPFDLDIPF